MVFGSSIPKPVHAGSSKSSRKCRPLSDSQDWCSEARSSSRRLPQHPMPCRRLFPLSRNSKEFNMRSRCSSSRMAAAVLIARSLAIAFAVSSSAFSAAEGQQGFHALAPIQGFAFDNAGPVIRAHSEPVKPFTVAGERGVLLGQQDGTFESWVLPVKLLSHLTIEAEVSGYGVPIDVNRESAEIEVRPDRTVITYSHPTFTVRQIMFSPDEGLPGVSAQTGPVVLFEFDCLHPTDFTFRFTPELRWMWPERNEGTPGADWETRGGFYTLHTDYPDLAGAVTIPGARPGILVPYQE